MVNKSGAGMLWLHAGVFLLGACLATFGPGAFAQDFPAALDLPAAGAVAEPETMVPAAPEAMIKSAPRLPPDQRLESLKSADLATLKAAQDDCMEAAKELTEKIPDLHREMRAAYENARNSPEAQALQQQIKDLEAQLIQTLENAPAVLEKRQAIDQAQRDMLAELRLRTTLGGLILQKGGLDDEAAPAGEAEPTE